METSVDKVEVKTDDGKPVLLQSSVDVLACLKAVGALDVDFGGLLMSTISFFASMKSAQGKVI